MRKLPHLLSFLGIFAAALTVVGCGGGGGGGDDFVGAALVSIRLQPNVIDTGDRTLVTTAVGAIHQNGIALKFRFPTGLQYVSGSATLEVDDQEIDLTPTFNQTDSNDRYSYVVFFLKQALFAPAGESYDGQFGNITFQLEGVSSVSSGEVAVDPDVNDPKQPDAAEFDVNSPEFEAEDQADIEVRDQ